MAAQNASSMRVFRRVWNSYSSLIPIHKLSMEKGGNVAQPNQEQARGDVYLMGFAQHCACL